MYKFKAFAPSTVLVSSVVVATIGIGLWKLKPYYRKHAATQYLRAEDRLLRKDESVLELGQGTDTEIYAAMARLARFQEPIVRSRALELAQSPSPLLRRGAAIAFGHYEEPETLQKLAELCRDQDPGVRKEALRALGIRPQPAREKILEESLKGSYTIRTEERIEALSSLFKITSSSDQRAKVLKEMIEIVQSRLDAKVRQAAFIGLFNLAPRDPLVISLGSRIATTQIDPALKPLALKLMPLAAEPGIQPKPKARNPAL